MGRAVFIPFDDKVWLEYYVGQAKQTGHGGMTGFQGIPYQRGNGLGSFFGRLFRSILPVAKNIGKSALKTVGKEALHLGANVMNDVVQGRNVKQALKKQGKKSTQKLINRAATVVKNQTGGQLGKRKVSSKITSVKKKARRTNKKQDIFSHG